MSVLSHVSFGRRVQVRRPWYAWCAARGHEFREQQRGIADEIDSLREAMAKEKERAKSADVECIHLTGWSCPRSTSLPLPALFLYHLSDTHIHTDLSLVVHDTVGQLIQRLHQPLSFALRRLLTDPSATLGCTYNVCVCV